MSLITVSATDVIEYHGRRVPAYAVAFANVKFTTSEGVIVAKGSEKHPEFGQRFDVRQIGDKIRILTGDLYTTTDSSDPDEASYNVVIYDIHNRPIVTVYEALRVPEEMTPVTWDYLRIYSQGRRLREAPTYLTSAEILALLNGLSIAPYASDVIHGKVRLTVPAVTLNDPVVPGNNDPMILAQRDVRYLREWTDIGEGLADAIADIGVTVCRLVVTEPEQEIIDGTLQTSGTLAIKDAYEIVDYAGVIADTDLLFGGTGYAVTAGVGLTGGSGIGATANITFVLGGVITGWEIANPGTGYKVGDRLTFSGGGANALLEVVAAIGTDKFQNVSDFTLYGDDGLDYRYVNQPGTLFVAESATPTVWSAGSSLRACLTLPENITLDFQGGSLKVINDGGLYIKSMIDPGNTQVFVTDGSGKVFVDPGAVIEMNLAWWAGNGTGLDDTHEFRQLQQSLSVARRGGVARIPAANWYTDEIKWTNNVTVEGSGRGLDAGVGTTIYAATLANTYKGVFSMQQRAVNIRFNNLMLHSRTSTTVSAFRYVLTRPGSYNISFDHVHFYNNGASGAANLSIFDGTGSWHEFINYLFHACQWTATTNTNALYWRSTNNGAQFNIPQFRVGTGSTCMKMDACGFVTIVNPDWRGAAGYTLTPTTNRTITARANATIATDILTLKDNDSDAYIVGNYFTPEDVGRYVINATGLPDAAGPTDQKYYIKYLNNPWEAVLGGGPNEDGTATASFTLANLTVEEPGLWTGGVAEACIDVGTHINLTIIGGADEGFNYFIKDGAADYRDEINLKGCFIQSAIDFDGSSSTILLDGCDIFSRTLIASTGNPIIRRIGGTTRRYPVHQDTARYPWPGMELGVAEPWRERGNNADFVFDSSFRDYASGYEHASAQLGTVMTSPMVICDPLRAGGLDGTHPWLTILSPSTVEPPGDYMTLLRLGQAYWQSKTPRLYYDFKYNPLTGGLELLSNHPSADYRLFQTNARIVTARGVLSTDAVDGIGYLSTAGDAVTQDTSKGTTVEINAVSGQITMHNAALGAGALVTFYVQNSSARNQDVPVACHISGGTNGAYNVWAHNPIALNGFYITVKNETGAPLSEAIVLQFNIFRGSKG